MKSYTFIIDTNQYAGNFERHMCAFMTGMIGDCGIGEEYAKMYKNCGLSPMKELLTYKSDEHGVYRPCGIFPTPGWINSGYKNYRYVIDNLDEEKALAEYNENIEKEAKKIESQIYQGKDTEYSKKQADQYRKNYKRDKLQKWPAYNSVGIYMVVRPTDKEIALLKERAHAFTSLKSEHPCFSSISIEGFRLLVETTSSHLEAI